MWHQDITIGDLHYIRSKFAEACGLEGIYRSSFNKATEVFYHSKQYAVHGDKFLTWAYFDDEGASLYVNDDLSWMDKISSPGENLWAIEASIHHEVLLALRNLSRFIPETCKTLSYLTADGVRDLTLRGARFKV